MSSRILAYSRIPKANARIVHYETDCLHILKTMSVEDLQHLQSEHRIVFLAGSKIKLENNRYIDKGKEITLLCQNDVLIDASLAAAKNAAEKFEKSEKKQDQKTGKSAGK